MSDHAEMLYLLSLDALRVEDPVRAQILFEAAEYLRFLETSLMDEMDAMRDTFTSKIAALETELESLRY